MVRRCQGRIWLAGRPTSGSGFDLACWRAILEAMASSSMDYHGSTLRSRSFDDLGFSETRHPAGLAVARHAHHAATLCLVLAGGFEEWAGRSRLDVSTPTVLVRGAGEPHADRFGARDAHCFNILLGRAWLARHGLDAPPWAGIALVGGEVAWLARRLQREFCTGDSSLVLQGLLLTLLGEAEREACRRRSAAPAWLPRVDAYLRDTCLSPLDMTQVAAAAGVHPAHLAREFRRHRRTTVGEHVRRLRIDLACTWIDAGRSLAEVASAAGFADQSHFGRVFRRTVGVSPGAYRRARASRSRSSRPS